ncbi:MAG TPA: Gldg family protein [Stellaceae bacterium]|nr:Gldg family protein [Stellaceae bacterium]
MARVWRIGQGMRSRAGRAVVGLISILVMLLAANIVAARYATPRLDLTQEHLYTLAKGTQQTLAKIEEPITLRFYYSPHLGDAVPSYGVYAQRVRELLDQYVVAAKGKLRLEIYDPLPYSDTEDRAVAYGLQPAPLNDRGEAVYFGLAGTNSTDDQQVIAFFNPERERFLEYDLTRLIHTLAFPKRKVAGLLTSLPLGGETPAPIIEQLRQTVDVKDLPLDVAAIPADTDVLLIVHPQDLPERTQFAIDQYVLKGGKALVFVDPYSEAQAALANAAGKSTASDLDRLFKAWGVKLLDGVVAGDRHAARRVAVPVQGRGSQALDYVAWLNLQSDNLSRDDPITADLSTIAMATAGILQPIEGATTKFDPLIQTSTEAEQIPVDKVKGLPDVGELLAHFRPDGRRYVLAAHVTGTAATAFPDGAPKDAAPGEPLKEAAPPINVVVVADTDMLDARFWAQSRDFLGRQVIVPLANNADFFVDAVEVLAGGQDLVDLRSRGTVARPFEVVERIQRSADDRFAAQQRTLEEKVKQAEAKLHKLTAGDTATGSGAPTADQSKEIEAIRADLIDSRRQLRQVQAALRSDIEHLKVMLAFFDIALVPIIVAVAALVMAALRRPRRGRVSEA